MDNLLNQFKVIKTINQHNDEVRNLIKPNDNRIITCSNDTTLKVFEIFEDLRYRGFTIKKHSSSVTYIDLINPNKIVSCSTDRTIKFISINESLYKCEFMIEKAHKDIIVKVISLSFNRIASCSNDKSIKIWKSNYPYSDTPISVLNGHDDIVSSIIQLVNTEYLLSGSHDNTLRIWSLISYQCVSIISDVYTESANSLLQFDDNRVIVGGMERFEVVDIKKGSKMIKMGYDGLREVNAFMKWKNDIVLMGCRYGFIGIFCINKGNQFYVRDTEHKKSITSLLRKDENSFYSTSEDGSIKIWIYN